MIKEGYQIPIVRKVPLSAPVFMHNPSQALRREVQSLIDKGAVEEAPKNAQGFFSTVFLVPKPDGSFRPVLNLSKLNKFVKLEKFKMDNMNTVLAALNPDMWAARIDLKDAYLQVPIHKESRHLLRFIIGDKAFQFKALPFGLCSAPFLFTQIVNVVAGYLRQRGLNILTYLDDWLVLSYSANQLHSQIGLLLEVLNQLGFIINEAKSEFMPSQEFQYLGVIFNTRENKMMPGKDNRQRLLGKVKHVQKSSTVSAQTMLALLGSMNFAAFSVQRGRLHMRPIQMWLLSRWKLEKGLLSDQLVVSEELCHHLVWWTEKNLEQGKPLFPSQPTFTIQSDASLEGWGGVMHGVTARGLWTHQEKNLHINNLELMALFNCLKQFKGMVQNNTVLCQVDNTSVVWYVKKEGGTKSADLCLLVWKVLHWCDEHNINLIVRHLPGRLNVIADQLSRKSVHTEWSLHPAVFKALVKTVEYPPMIDLFATSMNNKLPSYFSPIPDPMAMGIDALSQSWKGVIGYAFPPMPILPLVLKKIRKEECVIILIAPLWPKRSWFAMMMELMVECPVKLPPIPKLLSQNGLFHRNPEMFNYHAWTLSGKFELRRDFLSKQPTMQEKVLEIPQSRFTPPSGRSSVVGVWNNRLIHSRSLLLN